MPARTVDAALNITLGYVQTTSTETAQAKSHRASIEAVLKSSFGMTHFFRTGSFGNGTNVSGFSDVDYFAVIPTANLKRDSTSTLIEVATALDQRFPQTGIHIDGPAISVPFGTNGDETTEVVPVDVTGLTFLNFRQFDMPDGNGGWMFSAPESHDAYVTMTDDALGNKVKPLIRLVKAWKFIKQVPIKSFYLEMWVTAYAQKEASIYYRIDLQRIFRQLADANLPAIIDPRFPNDGRYLIPTNDLFEQAMAVNQLTDAADAATWANIYTDEGNAPKAFEQWDKIFDDHFPAYG